MARRIPAHIREQQINKIPNTTFVRWDGEYSGSYSKVICRCDAGHEWSASVHNLLAGSGCPRCAVIRTSGRQRVSTAERIAQINTIPNVDFVRWCDGDYRNAHSKAVCRCGAGHEWVTSVTSLIIQGTGCPRCAEYGYNPSKVSTLYALRSECGTMVKVGISNDYERRQRELTVRTPFSWSCVGMIHSDGALIASLEKAFHGMTEPVTFTETFDGYTEWRKWVPEITDWFNTWKLLTSKENNNV